MALRHAPYVRMGANWWLLGGFAAGIMLDCLLLLTGQGTRSPAAPFLLFMMPYAGVLAGALLRKHVSRRYRPGGAARRESR